MSDVAAARQREELEQRILDGAIAELAARNIASFTLEGVAERLGVDARTIRQTWPNTPELLTAALTRFGAHHLPLPDTGSLRGDLLAYAASYAAMLNSPVGRRLVDSMIIKPQDWDLTASRPAMLEKRFLRVAVLFARGVVRGECLPEVDPVRIIDMIGIGLCLPVLFYDRPVDEEDCEFVVDLVLNGVRPR